MEEFSGSIDDRLASYCRKYGVAVQSRLGFGKDGSVWATTNPSAIKVFESPDRYVRERDVYARLASHAVEELAGHFVPKVLRTHDVQGIIEMSIVRPPFVLDFASAKLDSPPDFPEDVLAEWYAEKREQFGKDWPKAAAVIRALERMGIHMLDVHPGNIRER